MTILLMMIFAHLLCDYPLQGDFMAKAKNRLAPFPGVPWQTVLLSHAAIHGFAVAAITGSAYLGIAELIAHALIDDAKCRNKLTFNQDQVLHISCKFLWAAIAIAIATQGHDTGVV